MSLRTAEQLRQARAALNQKQSDVAEGSGVSLPTIKRLEKAQGELPVRLETLSRLQSYFMGEGIRFLGDGDSSQGHGVSFIYTQMQFPLDEPEQP